jgi:hypothetical protein
MSGQAESSQVLIGWPKVLARRHAGTRLIPFPTKKTYDTNNRILRTLHSSRNLLECCDVRLRSEIETQQSLARVPVGVMARRSGSFEDCR